MTPRMTTIANTVTAAAVSLAAITSGAAPAEAGNKDLFRALAGIAAIAVFAGAIQQNQAHAAQPAQPLPQQPSRSNWQDGWQNDGWQNNWQGNDHPVQADRGGPQLPAACALEFDGPRPATYYAEACLKREGVGYALPQYCAQQIRSRDWSGRVYEADCLRDAGYRTPRWR